MGEVELFEVGKVRDAGDVCEAVGLNRNDAEVLEGVEVLYKL